MIAIIIPYYNLEYFESTLVSLSNQTDQNYNLYVFDDNSFEDPSLLLKKFENLKIKYHKFSENVGNKSLVKHWERSIAQIGTEEWIMILGDDDFLENDVIERFNKNLELFEGKTNLVKFASKMINEKTKVVSKIYQHPHWEKAQDSYYRRISGLTRSTLSEYVFTKKTYNKFGFHDFPLAWHSDDMAWLEFSDNKPIYSINETFVNIRISNFNISGKDDNFDLKYKASELFYENIVYEKLHLFSKKQKSKLLLLYESSVLNNRKLLFKEWRFLFLVYIINNQPFLAVKLIRRFLISHL